MYRVKECEDGGGDRTGACHKEAPKKTHLAFEAFAQQKICDENAIDGWESAVRGSNPQTRCQPGHGMGEGVERYLVVAQQPVQQLVETDLKVAWVK